MLFCGALLRVQIATFHSHSVPEALRRNPPAATIGPSPHGRSRTAQRERSYLRQLMPLGSSEMGMMGWHMGCGQLVDVPPPASCNIFYVQNTIHSPNIIHPNISAPDESQYFTKGFCLGYLIFRGNGLINCRP